MVMSNLQRTWVYVLAIGDGRALMPLTARRTAAALPYAGNYRIIDFVLSNCMHSGLRHINIFTQFNSLSVQNHVRDGWSIFNTDMGEFVNAVSPPITEELTIYNGQVDALFKNLYLLDGDPDDTILIISGEQIYRMDYAALVEYHVQRKAGVTIAAVDAETAQGSAFPARFKVVDGELRELAHGAVLAPLSKGEGFYGPMGVYAFRRGTLTSSLRALAGNGPRRQTLIELIQNFVQGAGAVAAYRFGGEFGRVSQDRYWRDLQSLDDYYHANMDLLQLDPPLDIYQPDWPIRTYQQQRPPARTVPGRSCNEGICVNSIVSGGTVIAGGGVSHSVLGNRVFIDDSAMVEDSIMFHGVTVGEGAQVRRAICDRDVHIPPGEKIGIDLDKDAKRFPVTPDGVVVIAADQPFD